LKPSTLDEIRKCVVEIHIGRVQALVRAALSEGIPPYDVFTEGIAKGMDMKSSKRALDDTATKWREILEKAGYYK
jgi:methanogenic corrinoid protein MtbC1